jgi:hypothetical protein
MKRCRTCHFSPCRCEDLEAGYMGQSCTSTCWPMVSEALAVHPKQVEQANARNKRHGSSVVYDPKTGCAVIPDRGERKRLLRIEQMHDNEGGYSD